MFSSSTLTAAFQAPITLSERNENNIRRRRRSHRFCCAGHQNEKSNNFTNNKSASTDEKRYLTKKDDSIQTHENESTTSLNRAISIASQSMCCIASTTGGFSNFELVARWFDLDTTTTNNTNNNNNEEDKDMNNKMGKLNERLMWKEEDTYERQMRLATASFLAATTVAVGQPALALDFVLVDPSVKEYMDQRDEAMSFKCKGGMMDCDGDRREFARAQAQSLSERLERGEKRTDCTVEEACTDNILGAALAGTSGFTTSEKFEKLGRPELADAPNASRPNLGF
ncbi:unnamed protein product [Bathycoccus prasinos]